MLKTANRWSLFSLIACAFFFFLCALAVYIVDPFELYRESPILPLYDQESYNNPGIARNYDYDAVILGTSMVEMSNPSVIDECFGVRSVKLPMRGSYTAQMGYQLERVLSFKPDLKLAILALDAYSLVGDPDDTTEIVDYLWNDNKLDDVKYLLNFDVLSVRLPKLLKNKGLSLENKRDTMYKWTEVEFTAQKVFDTVAWNNNAAMKPADYLIERSTENIARHLEPLIKAHPETTFKIYMPPYSSGYWYHVSEVGLLEQQIRTRKLVCEMLLGYPNVEIYDYSSRVEWITNLNEYFDYSHHSETYSDMVMRAMRDGENRVLSSKDMDEGSERLRKVIEDFTAQYEPLFVR